MTDEQLISDGLRILEEAQEKGLVLRIIGALAVWLHSKDVADMYRKLGRLGTGPRTFTDLDLMGYGSQAGKVAHLLEKEMRFTFDTYFLMRMGGKKRHKYYHPANLYAIDVFFDMLESSHTIYFGEKPGKGRLELDYPTISLTDLFLEKANINQINEKDIKDLVALLRCHELTESEQKETINVRYAASLLAQDWGYYYDVTTNLAKLKVFLQKYLSDGLLTEEDFKTVSQRTEHLLSIIENEPKTPKWKIREKIGTAKPWYNVVEAPRTMNF